MIKTLTHHYKHTLALGHRILLGVLFVMGIFTALISFLHAEESLLFQDEIETIFTWWIDTGYYSNTSFEYGGNDFVGIIFWQTGENLSPAQNITISGWAQSINCSTHLRGIYYNNQRGRRIWPLDTWNLATLVTANATWYSSMNMTWGFYTNCTWVNWYTPAANEVYGQITHVVDGVTWELFAGIDYDFTENTYSWTYFSGSMTITTGWVHEGHIFDTAWGIAKLGMNLAYCGWFEVFPTELYVWETGTFLCQWNSLSGYILSISPVIWWLTYSPIYTDMTTNTWTSYSRLTGSYLSTWEYVATCTVLSSPLGGSECWTDIPFTVLDIGSTPPSGTWCTADFQGEISFASLRWSTVYASSIGTYYTDQTDILLKYSATASNTINISGDFAYSPITGPYTRTDFYTDIVDYPITLLHTDSRINFTSTFTTGDCTYTDLMKRVYVDTVAPTAPTITLPISGTNVCPSLPFTLSRTAADDGTWAGISHYIYEIYDNSGMTTGLLLNGTVTSTSTTISQIALLPIGTYYVKVIAVDNVGHTTSSQSVSFSTSSHYCSSGTGIMIVTPVISITNADLDTVYRSQPIYILWLTWPTQLNISTGMLFINDNTGWLISWATVTSQDTIYIELISSQAYETTVSSTLSIAWHTGMFSVTTKALDCVLSAAEQLVIQNIYNTLKDQYNNDLNRLSEFLHTFQSMVDDELQLSNDCNLEYLLSLIENDFGNEGIDISNHITPNCKEYSIGYDIGQQWYFSPNMMQRYYFINRESLIRHLDFYNPGDCHINTYNDNYRTANTTDDTMRHIAPNGKIYNLIGQYGGYSAEEFISPKYFDSLQGIKYYIDIKNPAKTIWKHDVDNLFMPIVYAAPNGKEYRIYKTNKWFMSYKLMNVKYFDSLSWLKTYIDKNNPSVR